MQMRRLLVAGALTAFLLAPATAKADWLFTPFVGAGFGGDAAEAQLSWGASLGYMGAGVFGLELEFNTVPDFFAPVGPVLEDNNVTTLMGNLIIGAPVGGLAPGFRPYFTAGVGLMRTRVSDVEEFFNVSGRDWGMNAGFGAIGFFGRHAGLRGDLRYFRNLAETALLNDFDVRVGGFDYWRGTLGLTFRF
jgi:hypothetical protein